MREFEKILFYKRIGYVCLFVMGSGFILNVFFERLVTDYEIIVSLISYLAVIVYFYSYYKVRKLFK